MATAAPSRPSAIATPAGEVPVRVENLRKTYRGGVEALRGVSFDVHDGEIFGLLGPNGAGKTTTVGILTTTIRASSGTAVIAGHDANRDPLSIRGTIGVVFQESVLDNGFSGRENLMLHARLWRVPRPVAEKRIETLLEAMDLTDRADHGVRTYSGGMRRRLELARALLATPRVVFLDEPTVGLDPAVRRHLWELIEDLRRREGATIMVTTHYLEEAEAACARVGVMHRGQLVAIDSPANLIDGLGRETLELRLDSGHEQVVEILAGSGLGRVSPVISGDTVRLPIIVGSDAVTSHLDEVRYAGFPLTGTTVRRTTLNDVYLHLISGSRNPQQDERNRP